MTSNFLQFMEKAFNNGQKNRHAGFLQTTLKIVSSRDVVKALFGISCHLGSKTCLNEVASALRLVMTHLDTGEEINTLIEDEEFAAANGVEVIETESSVFTEESAHSLQVG